MTLNISRERRHVIKRIIVNREQVPKKKSKQLLDHADVKSYGDELATSKIEIARQLSQEFLHDSSLHGVKYLGNLQIKSNNIGKLFWALIMICSFVFLTWMIWKFWARYIADPIRTVVDTFQAPIHLITFPAITLCPLIPPLVARRRKLLQQLRLPHNMDNDTAMFLLKYGPAFANERVPGGKAHLNNLKALLKINHMTILDFLKFLRPCEDLLESCWWDGIKVNCSELFKISHTFAGICCSFNYLLEDYIKTGRTRNDSDILRTPLFGARTGLVAILHRDLLTKDDGTGEFIRFSTNSVGIVVFPHHPLEYVGGISAREILQARQELRVVVTPYVNWKLTNYYHLDDSGTMTPHCASENTKLKYFPTYRYSNCFISCSIQAVFQACGCVPYYYAPIANKYSMRICDWEDFNCLYLHAEHIRIIQNVVKENFTCKCINPCKNTYYEIQTSTILLNGEQDCNVSPIYKNLTNLQAILRVYLNSETFVKTGTIPIADELYLLASVGGIFSLFVGCSFISAAEIFYFIMLFLRSYCNSKKSK